MTIEQLRNEVEEKINAIEYNWQDTNNNIRIMLDIRENVDNIPAIPSAKHIAEVAVSCNDYLQMRDFLMGLPTEKPREKVITYLTIINDAVSVENAVPTLTVLSSFMYELDKPESARSLLNIALEANPDYSLANLLNRVYNAEWPSRMLTDMSADLHPKVVKTIETGVPHL